MNPGTVEQKKSIIDILNKADLDLSTGTYLEPINRLADLKGQAR